MNQLILGRRLPISPSNIELYECKTKDGYKDIINEKSIDADLIMMEFSYNEIDDKYEIFKGYESLANILFVNSRNEKELD